MRKVALLLLTLPWVWACSPDSASAPAAPEQDPQLEKARLFRLSYATPEPVDSTAWRYQLVGWARKEDRSVLSSDSYSGSSGYTTDAFNVAFFGPHGAGAHLLLPHGRYSITAIDAKAHPVERWPYVFYEAIVTDSNQNKALGPEDAKVLFASDRQGYNLLPVTPDTAAVEAWQAVPPHSLQVALRLDSDRNRRFDYTDAVRWFRYDLRNLRAAPAPLLPLPLQAQLKQQLTDYHLRYPEQQ